MSDQLEELGLEPLVGSDAAMSMAGWKSPTTLQSAINDGNFPEPDRVIGRIRKWKPSTLRKWQNCAKEEV